MISLIRFWFVGKYVYQCLKRDGFVYRAFSLKSCGTRETKTSERGSHVGVINSNSSVIRSTNMASCRHASENALYKSVFTPGVKTILKLQLYNYLLHAWRCFGFL